LVLSASFSSQTKVKQRTLDMDWAHIADVPSIFIPFAIMYVYIVVYGNFTAGDFVRALKNDTLFE